MWKEGRETKHNVQSELEEKGRGEERCRQVPGPECGKQSRGLHPNCVQSVRDSPQETVKKYKLGRNTNVLYSDLRSQAWGSLSSLLFIKFIVLKTGHACGGHRTSYRVSSSLPPGGSQGSNSGH